MKKFLSYFVPVVVCLAVGGLASYIQSGSIHEWYPALERSPLTPPNIVFPIAWSVIYLLVGLSLGHLLSRGDRSLVALWMLQLFVNFMWCVLFFAFRNPMLGLLDILLLDVLVCAYIVYAYGRSRIAAWLFVPYMLWLMFATYLNGYILVHNGDGGRERCAVAATLSDNLKNNIDMTYTVPALPYEMDALSPAMSRETLEYHYGKHLRTYVDNLNRLIEGTPYKDMEIEKIICEADGAVYNNAAQTWNHIFFFDTLTPSQKPIPARLEELLKRDFGSVDEFIAKFSEKAVGLFGSGWVWLVADEGGKLSIVAEPNAGNPLRAGLRPLLTVDVWEHAYYIDYRNRRADFVKSYWNIVDWDKVDSRLG